MVSLTAALTEESYQRLWQPPVPKQVLQFVVANAAIYYTAEKTLRHIEEGKDELGELEQVIEGLLAAPNITFRERKALQGISEFRAMAEEVTQFCQQLMSYASQAQWFFGAKAAYNPQVYAVEIALQTPLGQRHVFFAPGGNIPPSNGSLGSWHNRSTSIASLKYLVQAELDEALTTGQAALQHAVDRVGLESSHAFKQLMDAYVGCNIPSQT